MRQLIGIDNTPLHPKAHGIRGNDSLSHHRAKYWAHVCPNGLSSYFQCLQFGSNRILPDVRLPVRSSWQATAVLFHAFVNQNGYIMLYFSILLYYFKVISLIICVYSG